jgi:hypothetical protein
MGAERDEDFKSVFGRILRKPYVDSLLPHRDAPRTSKMSWGLVDLQNERLCHICPRVLQGFAF